MVFYVLAALLFTLFAADMLIGLTTRDRSEGSRWERWQIFGYGPLFVTVCLALALDVFLEPGWSWAARRPVLLGLPVVAGVFGVGWFVTFRRRLRSLRRARRADRGTAEPLT
ncbi:hypothetical protein BX265_7531 [Streptomyces sp. TLI_235]|nr:hypothetical protein [Streptomyces sp. TLI_235]PBC70139.1 hypothetical protein BX265_7531 [Streptomyces sp. TLI_235]